MIQRIVRTGTRLGAGERHPQESAYADTGTGIIPDDHLARCASRVVSWLDETKAPAGRRFVPEDAPYLIRDEAPGA